MKTLLMSLAVTVLLAFPAGASAQNVALQAPLAVQRAVEDFLRIQTSGLSGHATFTTGTVDPKLALPACGALEVFTPAGGRLWGNSSVGVRCGAPTPWTIYVAVTVRVQGPYLAAARAIPAGQALAHGDLTLVQGSHPDAAVDSERHVAGARENLERPLAPGQPLRADALRVVPAIMQGQTVKLVSQGAGFRVSADGKALSNAAAGQLAQVRTGGGQTVSGVARADGTVEINF